MKSKLSWLFTYLFATVWVSAEALGVAVVLSLIGLAIKSVIPSLSHISFLQIAIPMWGGNLPVLNGANDHSVYPQSENGVVPMSYLQKFRQGPQSVYYDKSVQGGVC